MSARRRSKGGTSKVTKKGRRSAGNTYRRDGDHDAESVEVIESPTMSALAKPRRHLFWMLLALLGLMAIGVYWGLPAYWVHHAENALNAGRYAEANHFFEKAEPWPAQRDAAMLGRIRVARFLGEPARAIALLTTARSAGVAKDQLHFERTLLEIQCGDDDSSVDQASALLVRFPERGSEIMEAVVNRNIRQGRTERALRHIDDWIEAAADDARALSYKAEIIATNGEINEAETLFRAAIKLEPSLRRARLGLAKLLKHAGKYQEAIDHFDVEIASDPENLTLRLLRCDALLQMRRGDEAIESLQQILELDELNFPARHSLASQYARQGEHGRVIDVLQPLMDSFGDDASINYLLASAYSARGETERADRYLQKHMDGRKRLDELTLLTRSLSDDPPDQSELLRIARDYLKYQWDVAEPWIIRAIESSPDSPDAFAMMAEFQRKRGDAKQASQYEQAARSFR